MSRGEGGVHVKSEEQLKKHVFESQRTFSRVRILHTGNDHNRSWRSHVKTFWDAGKMMQLVCADGLSVPDRLCGTLQN